MNKHHHASQKQIYIWNITGSIANAATTVLMLMLVSWFLTPEDSDLFTISWSLAMQAATIGCFSVRLYQSTDIQEKYSFEQYFFIRYLTVAAMILYTLVYTAQRTTIYSSAVIMFLCLSRAIDVFSDLFQGWFQQKERLDLSGKALTAHSIAYIVSFCIGLVWTQDLLLSCVLILATQIFTFVLFDYRYFRFMRSHYDARFSSSRLPSISILTACLPLFINAFIITDIFNCPKLAIDNALQSGSLAHGAQTVYGILFLPASVLNLVFLVFRPMVTDLAISWAAGRFSDFLTTVVRIGRYLLGISLLILLAGYFLGCPLLSLLYQVDLSGYRSVLMVIIVGGLFNTFMYLMDNAITVIRRQSYLIIAYLIAWVCARCFVDYFVSTGGLLGAALTFSLSMLVLLICTSAIFLFSLLYEHRGGHSHA